MQTKYTLLFKSWGSKGQFSPEGGKMTLKRWQHHYFIFSRDW